ncbi:MAG: RagB/SusD family nutrient uptake outer membrane protein, partial [Phocaeicola sp.]
MKPIQFKIAICAALFTMAGCTDLDVDIKSQYTEYPDSELAAEAVTANVYYAMRGPYTRDYNHAQTLSAGEAVGVSMGSDWYDGGRYMNMCTHAWTPDDAAIGYWETVMGGITNSNQALVLFGDPDNETSAHIRAVRAYYYWVLMDSYGDVPIIDKPMAENEVINRSKRGYVARFIESELLAVMDKLTTTVDATTYGKPTRYM